MSDAPLPPDEPRLRTLERYLLTQLAAVRQALQAADDTRPTPRQEPADDDGPRWCIDWQRTPVGQPRRGTVHRADCWMARGRPLDTAQLAEAGQQYGRAVQPCTACEP